MVALKEQHEAVRLTAVAVRVAERATEVQVVHVVEIDSAHSRAEGDAMVEYAVDLLQAQCLLAEGRVVMATGTVVGRLAELARASRAELVVMGSRGLGHLGGLLGRSVSHGLLAGLELPVLIVPDKAGLPAHGFRRVLAALRSEDDVQPAASALQLLQPQEVLAVHVPRLVAAHAGSTRSSGFVEMPETSTMILAEARRALKRAGIRVTTRTLPRSDVAAAITEAARTWHADAIVLGSRRLRDWEALIGGSTSHDVLRLSGRPVFISGRSLHRGTAP